MLFDSVDFRTVFVICVFVGGFFLVVTLTIFFMIYVFAVLVLLCFIFATIARFTYIGDSNKLGTYRGLMITTYIFLILIDVGMLFYSYVLSGVIGVILSIGYTILLVINMRASFKANVVDYPMNYQYYNQNMYYGQGMNYNNQAYNNQNYYNHIYNN